LFQIQWFYALDLKSEKHFCKTIETAQETVLITIPEILQSFTLTVVDEITVLYFIL